MFNNYATKERRKEIRCYCCYCLLPLYASFLRINIAFSLSPPYFFPIPNLLLIISSKGDVIDVLDVVVFICWSSFLVPFYIFYFHPLWIHFPLILYSLFWFSIFLPFLPPSLLLCFLFGCMTCGILVPWPGIRPTPLAVKAWVLTTGPPGNSLPLNSRA